MYEQETEVITRLGLPDHRGDNQNLLQVHGAATIGGLVAHFKPQPEKDFQFEGCPAFPIELVTLYKSRIYIPDCDGKLLLPLYTLF